MIDPQDIKKTIESIYEGNTALDMLLEFEGILDDLHLYAYKNWKKGEVIAGPDISRYWVEVILMYPEKLMPDPQGAMRLTQHGCYVYFQKEELIVAKEIKDPDDLETNSQGERKPKKIKKPIWLVKIVMPRHFVDEFTGNQIEVNGVEIDMADVDSAYDEGLDNDKETVQDEGNE